MSKPTPPRPLPDEGEKAVEKVLRINQRWIVHGRLKDHAAAYLDHLRETNPYRLWRACGLALHMVRRKKIIRDPKPLFYAGLFAYATRSEIETYLEEHPVTRSIVLLLHGDTSGRDVLDGSARGLVEGISSEILEERNWRKLT
jgi:hypothetical protein